MQCKFIYGQNHKDVKANLRKLGSSCAAKALDDRGFCYNHLKEQGLLTPEEEAERIENSKKAPKARRDTAKKQKEEALSGGAGNYAGEILKAIKEFTEIQDFNLQDLWDYWGGDKILKGDLPYKRQKAFAYWLLAEPASRKPDTLNGVSIVIGIPTWKLESLQKGNHMKAFIRNAREEVVLERCEPAYLAWMANGVNYGDKQAVAAFEKLREKHTESLSKEVVDIPEEIKKQAEEINKQPLREAAVTNAVGWNVETEDDN